ncbi:hypothetical protein MHY85_05450 [Cellulomonas sp. ACRRI]|uniref:hypothetical protein n=1 Tax=Cellulomonas sp. ACRRI TaxID=2918188 RepID=UPI001EF2AB1F|nr:hypothetical protein [Cellulomonas sp. ACRRI]MCG7285420.1 hypothetical protein [Cellulomonas sp. ACRRI]
MDSTTRVDPYTESIKLDIHDLTRVLNENVGAAVVAAMTGAGSRTLPYKWASTTEPRPETQERLRLAYRVWRTLSDSEGRNVTLAWLTGANPLLGEATPVTRIRELNSKDVIGAARAFVDDLPA